MAVTRAERRVAEGLAASIKEHEKMLKNLRAVRLRRWASHIKAGMTHTEIAKLYKVKPSTISVALMRKASR